MAEGIRWFIWLVRTVHILAGAAWVGGSLMYLLVVLPALRGASDPGLAGRVAALFKQLVNVAIGLLLLSGAFLVFDRLTQTTLGLPYLVVLVLKVVAALVMCVLAIYLGQNTARKLAKRTTRLSKLAPQLILALGILVFVLGALLNMFYEAAIAPH